MHPALSFDHLWEMTFEGHKPRKVECLHIAGKMFYNPINSKRFFYFSVFFGRLRGMLKWKFNEKNSHVHMKKIERDRGISNERSQSKKYGSQIQN